MRVVLVVATAFHIVNSKSARDQVLGRTTNQATQLEVKNRCKESPFQGKIFVRFPPRRLKRGQRHEKSGRIPTDLVQAVKLVGYARNCGGDDSLQRR